MKKSLILIALGLFILFFIGIIDVGYEYSDLHLFIKYPPTINFYFFCPDGLVEQAEPSAELLYYNQYLKIWGLMGIGGYLISIMAIQLFLAILFVSFPMKYTYKHLVVDLILFTVCFIIASFTINYVFYINRIGWYIFLSALLVLLNYFIWNKVRNNILKLILN